MLSIGRSNESSFLDSILKQAGSDWRSWNTDPLNGPKEEVDRHENEVVFDKGFFTVFLYDKNDKDIKELTFKNKKVVDKFEDEPDDERFYKELISSDMKNIVEKLGDVKEKENFPWRLVVEDEGKELGKYKLSASNYDEFIKELKTDRKKINDFAIKAFEKQIDNVILNKKNWN